MAFAPLILRGNLKVNTTDVSDQVTSFTFMGQRATIDIPQTFGAKSSFAAAGDSYSVEIAYLQDTDSSALTMIFWDALASVTGEVTVAGSFESGIVGASNPLFTGTAIVTGAGIGGAVNTVGQQTFTFPLKAVPVKTTS